MALEENDKRTGEAKHSTDSPFSVLLRAAHRGVKFKLFCPGDREKVWDRRAEQGY